jgi:hypothetical protein
MPVQIREIVTEVVLSPEPSAPGGPAGPVAVGDLPEEVVDRIVRRATERVLDGLRREWDR